MGKADYKRNKLGMIGRKAAKNDSKLSKPNKATEVKRILKKETKDESN